MFRVRKWMIALAVAAVGGPVAAYGILQSTADEARDAVPPVAMSTAATTARVASAKAALPGLTVKGRAAKTGYSRAKFGDGWAKVKGCDMRNRVLARDLVEEKRGPNKCTVLSGKYVREPYTGKPMTFIRAGSYAHALDIDHVYPLSLAWQQGAWNWTDAKRDKFANDSANLLATDPSANRQKGDSGPASWLPMRNERCDYVSRFVVVAVRYKLSVNPPDHDMAERVLDQC